MNILKKIFILVLVCFSFFYTDKIINLINKNDPLMKEIENKKDNYLISPVNAHISEDTVIPGIKGREVNIEKSYSNMKVGGIFREEELSFDELLPSSSISNNKDKYIIKGNTTNKKVSLIYILDIKDIKKINNLSNITIFINHKNITIDNINKLKDKEIYTYGNNGVYSDNIIQNDNNIINSISNNKSIYCLAKEKNINVLNTCNKNDMYVIIPTIEGNYLNIKNNISNGSIILLDNLNNIDIIYKYIISRGYEIVTLSNLLEE